MNPIAKFIDELQEVSLLLWGVVTGLFRPHRYAGEIIRQMDLIGVGSLPIVLLTGFFTGRCSCPSNFPDASILRNSQ
jgi:phospholipid/cholesterol/gamma-HCH transport system permease protein